MSTPNRRRFLTATTAAALTLTAESYANVVGANARLGVGFIGCGARAQAHVHLIKKLGASHQLNIPAVCDVWDGHADEYDHTFSGTTTRRRYSQGLYPTAKLAELNVHDATRVTKDYRRVLDRNDVDIVCISTPDHWHARQTLDALAAGKDVYVERPMARTAAEAHAVAQAAEQHNRVVVVGVQSLADPAIGSARELLARGEIGRLVQMQAGAFRNDIRGQWRFYRLLDTMTPKTIDWPMYLGHRFEVNGVRIGTQQPFDRQRFAQWRCYSPFSSGVISDLLSVPATRMLAVSGYRRPQRVVGVGGLVHELDGRDVPDVSTIIAEFAEGGQLLLTATTASNYPLEEVIRGRRGTIKFVSNGLQVFADDPTRTTTFPPKMDRVIEPNGLVGGGIKHETEAFWLHFLDCVRRRDRATLCPPDLGAVVVQILAQAWDNLRTQRESS